MAQVRWTPQASDDLDAVVEFIAADSPHFAALFVMDVFGSVERLVDFPKLGRVVPEMGDPVVREIILGNYRLIYRLRSDVAEVLTVYQGARLLDPKSLP